MARQLDAEEIAPLAKRKGVRRIAVENFLMSLDLNIGFGGNLWNLEYDAKSYGWDRHTKTAILMGLRAAFNC